MMAFNNINQFTIMLLVIFFAIVLTTAIVFIFSHLRKMAPFYILSSKLPGPFAFPIIGSAWRFINTNPEETMKTVSTMLQHYPSPSRFWLGSQFILIVSDPKNARIVLSTNRMNQKGDVYKFLMPLLGNGLISGSGIRWKTHRKLIQPHLNSDFVERNLNMFIGVSENFINALQGRVGMGVFDVAEIIQMYVADVLALNILGYDLEARNGKNKAFLKAPKGFYQLVSRRICKPWLQPDELFKFTKWNRIQKTLIEDMDKIMLKAIENAKNRIRKQGVKDDSPIVDKLLHAMEQNSEIMTEQELSFHLKTLFIASEDTIVNASAFALICLGMAEYSHHQEIISKEIQFLPPMTKITDPTSLPHLTRCIKEVLRLFPVGPYLFRETIDRFQLGDLILPPKCAVLIDIWKLHRDPKQWIRPDEFYPEHFESEVVNKRHPTSFIPFSVGARGCAGKALPYPWLKLILARVLEKFVVATDGDLKGLKLVCDVTIRPADGYHIKLKNRS